MKKNTWLTFTLLLLFFTLNLFSFQKFLKIPSGKEIKVDGTMKTDEWTDALQTDLKGGEFLKLKHDGSFLYLCIKGKILGLGIASVCLNTGDTVSILHASTGLITAVYKKKDRGWLQVEDFRSDKQRMIWQEKNKKIQKIRHLAEYLWLANTLPLKIPKNFGKQNAMEYKISLQFLKNGKSKLSVVLFQRMAKQQYACFPVDLKDDSLNRRMVSGGNIQYLKFQAESWPILRW